MQQFIKIHTMHCHTKQSYLANVLLILVLALKCTENI